MIYMYYRSFTTLGLKKCFHNKAEIPCIIQHYIMPVKFLLNF